MLPSNVRTRHRSFGFIDYRSGEEVSLGLPTGFMLLETWIKLKFTISNGADAPSDGLFGGIERIIKRLSLEVADQDEILKLDAPSLVALTQQDFGIVPRGHVSLTSGANDVQVIDVDIPLMHWLPNSQNPLLTAIDLRYVQSAALRLNWSDGPDFWADNGSAAISAVSCEVSGVYMDNIGGDVPTPFVRELGYQRHFIKQPDDRYKLQFEKRTGRLIRSITLLTTRDQERCPADATYPVLTGDVRVYSGGEQMYSVPSTYLLGRQRMMIGQAPNQAVYPIHFSNYGDPGQMLDTNQLQSALTIEAEVDGPRDAETAAEITAIVESVRPMRLS